MEAPRPQSVLLVVSNLGTGGAEWQSMHLAKGLAARGDDVTIVALGRVRAPLDPLLAAGVRVLALGAEGPRAKLGTVPTLMRLARKADVVHCTNWDASLYGRIAALLDRRPVVVADHFAARANHRSRRGAPRLRWVAAHHRLLSPLTAMTVACARFQEPVLLAEGVPRERLAYIPNGIPVDELRAAANGGVSRTAIGLPEDARVVMHVAKFRPEKNQQQTLATVAELRRSEGDVRAVFVGSGPQEEAVRRKARDAGADWAVFLGHRTDVPALMTLADVLVLPSEAEAMPMTILEGQALGVPIVASAVGDVRPMLEETGGGVCVARGDWRAFTDECRHVLEDDGFRAELSRRGLAASAQLDAATMVERYADVLGTAVARRRARRTALRVAHVGPDMSGRGGMPTVLRALFDSPLSRRYELTFIATHPSMGERGVDPRRRATMFAAGLLRLVAWSLGPGPRLVHVHAATRGSWYRKSLCVFAARAAGRPVILHVHAGPGDIAAFCARIGPVRHRLFASAFRAADRVLSVSVASAREVERCLGPLDILTVPNPPPVPARAPDEAPRDDGAVGVVYLGGFANPSKGGAVLVDALPALRASAPGVAVSLAGPSPAPAIDGLGASVRWLGWLEPDRAAAVLAAAQVVVLPSISEGLPMTLLEALSQGKAVVASRVGGIPEVITDGIDGVLVPPGDPEALARAVAGLATDPARRASLGRAARARAEHLRDHEVYGPLDRLYRELAGETAAALSAA